MGVGIAKKRGNAGGVKAPTAVESEGANIHYTSEVEKGWQEN
jgi:hypothetical protein